MTNEPTNDVAVPTLTTVQVGAELRIYANGMLIGTVEYEPDFGGRHKLVAHGVAVRPLGERRWDVEYRSSFPAGGVEHYDADDERLMAPEYAEPIGATIVNERENRWMVTTDLRDDPTESNIDYETPVRRRLLRSGLITDAVVMASVEQMKVRTNSRAVAEQVKAILDNLFGSD